MKNRPQYDDAGRRGEADPELTRHSIHTPFPIWLVPGEIMTGQTDNPSDFNGSVAFRIAPAAQEYD